MTQHASELSGDVITVIVQFLPLDDQLRSIRVCTGWFRAIQSLQIMWKQVLVDFLKIDQILGMDAIVDEYVLVYGAEEVDWLKILQLQFAKLPKKIKTGTRGIDEDEFSMRNLTREHYGNVGLVKDWVSPFGYDNSNIDSGDVRLPHSVSFYEFPFDIRSEIIEKYSDNVETLMEKLGGIYLACLVYELMSVGDYVPNLYNDIIRVIPALTALDELWLNNFTVGESFAAVLLCSLQQNADEIFTRWFQNEVLLKIKPTDVIYEQANPKPIPSQVTAETLIESIRTDGLSPDIQLCPNIEMEESNWLSLSDITTIRTKLKLLDNCGAIMNYSDDFLFPLYFNAGGGSYDIINVTFSIEEDGRIVKLIREESRTYY